MIRLTLAVLALAILAPALHEWVDTALFVRSHSGHCEPYDRAKKNVCTIVRFVEVGK